jgi:predicted RNA-binding protein with EMAP domain
VFNKTLVDMFNGILSKKELKKFNDSLQTVVIPDLKKVNDYVDHHLDKVNDYVDHHNDYIDVIRKKLQYLLEIYDMDNIEMRANAIAVTFGSINHFVQISNFLNSDAFNKSRCTEA